MNTAGDAADQVVRYSLEAGEVALKITGEAAKEIAVLLYTILKEEKKTKGRAKLETLIRSGKPLSIFSVKEDDMKKAGIYDRHFIFPVEKQEEVLDVINLYKKRKATKMPIKRIK